MNFITKFLFPQQKWGKRGGRITLWVEDETAQALRELTHKDAASGRMVSQNVIVYTALMKVPEFRQRYKELKKENAHDERSKRTTSDAKGERR